MGKRRPWVAPEPWLPIAAATVLGAHTVVPIHYGISGVDAYDEVNDPLDALIRVARGTAIEVQSVQPGAWAAWR